MNAFARRKTYIDGPPHEGQGLSEEPRHVADQTFENHRIDLNLGQELFVYPHPRCLPIHRECQLFDASLGQERDGFRGQGLGGQGHLQTEQAGQAVETFRSKIDFLTEKFNHPPRPVGVHLDPHRVAFRTLGVGNDPTACQEQEAHEDNERNPFDRHDPFPFLNCVELGGGLVCDMHSNQYAMQAVFNVTWLLLSVPACVNRASVLSVCAYTIKKPRPN